MSRARLLAALALAVALLGATTAYAAYRATTTNSGNTVTSAAPVAPHQLVAGSYTGNGAASREIATPGFQPDLLIVKGEGATAAYARTSTMAADSAKTLAATTAAETGLVTSLTTGGFSVSADSRVNQSGVVYHWIAVKASDDVLKVGTYTGSPGSTQAITGVGFQPEHVIVLPAAGTAALQRGSGATQSTRFYGNTFNTGIQSLDADGFTVNGTQTNANGAAYHWVAINEVAGSSDVGTYTGNAATRSITGVGFQPGWMLTRSQSVAGVNGGGHRSASQTGASSMAFSATAAPTTEITALGADGFSLGAADNVNANGVTFRWLALRATGTGCATPGLQTLTATRDVWVDQAAPATSRSADTLLRARAGTGANGRGLVAFTLPALNGCSVRSATLRMHVLATSSGAVLRARRASATWTEAGATWNAQPATTGGAATAVAPAGTGGTLDWTVTAQVADMYALANHGFQVRHATEDGATRTVDFGSRERGTAAQRPQLLLTLG